MDSEHFDAGGDDEDASALDDWADATGVVEGEEMALDSAPAPSDQLAMGELSSLSHLGVSAFASANTRSAQDRV